MKKYFMQVAKEHAKRYSLMEPQDFGKLAYQGEFGPEHLILNKLQAEVFLLDEWKTLQ